MAKAKANWLKNMKIREVSLVDDPANSDANIILVKRRRQNAQNASLARIIKDAGDSGRPFPTEEPTAANPGYKFTSRMSRKVKPMSKKRWQKTVCKVLEEEAARNPALVQAIQKRRDRQIAKQALKRSDNSAYVESAITKAQDAADTLDTIAKQMQSETGESYARCFTRLTASGEGAKLYGVSKGRVYAPDGEQPNNYAAGIDADEQAENTSDDGSDLDVDGATPDESMQAINDEADNIQAATKCSRVNALLQAGQRMPGHYANSRGAGRM